MILNKDMEKILSVITEMSKESNYYKLLEDILEIGMDISHSDAGTLYLLRNERLEFFFMITKSMNIKKGGVNEKIDLPPVDLNSSAVAALCARTKKIINVKDVYSDLEYNWSGPKKYDELTGYHTESVFVLPLFDKEKNVLGVMQLLNAKDDKGIIPFSKEVEATLYSLSTISGVLLDNINLYDNVKALLDSFVRSMVKAIESRTPYNASHTTNVAKYCGEFVDYLNKYENDSISDNDKEELVMGAMLHDVGKMVIKEEILNKATRFSSLLPKMIMRYELILDEIEIKYLRKEISEKEYKDETKLLNDTINFVSRLNDIQYLTDEDLLFIEKIKEKEYNIRYGVYKLLTSEELDCAYIKKGTLTQNERNEIERHVVYTDEILRELEFGKKYSHVKEIASLHHEFLDGSGYPHHLKGDELSKYVRIITICDIYDSLMAKDRPYKKPMPNSKAIAILKEMADIGKLDKDLVTKFARYRGGLD